MTNRLADATSPYLLQHKDNPVDWFEWSEEAFEEARRRDVPVLLSVGYAACHWCHVMAHESFEDPDTAALMNRLFVNVKVDREERPDVDSVYMEAVQAMSGRGGWPMTVWMDPDGRPFYAGTYYPHEPHHGMPSFREVMTAVSSAWHVRRSEVSEQAERLVAAISQDIPSGTLPDDAGLEAAYERLEAEYDPVNGGFGRAPKFPQQPLLEFLLRIRSEKWAGAADTMLERTLSAMAAGGIHDQIGGGFARYSVDSQWLVPHFEKMLYDNAQLARLYLWAGIELKRDDFVDVAKSTLNYLTRDLREPKGGFYSSEDADSDGVEGKFYVWTLDEIRSVLAEEAESVIRFYGLTEQGNFEDANILSVVGETAPSHLRKSNARLLEARSRRVRPGLDDKVVTAWNGLAIRAFAEAGAALGVEEFISYAREAAQFVVDNLVVEGVLMRSWRDGRTSVAGFLDDHAAMAVALFTLFAATGETKWYETAMWLLGQFDRFSASGGGFYTTPEDGDPLIKRPVERTDNPAPSGNALAVEALILASRYTGDRGTLDTAVRTLEAATLLIERYPSMVGHHLALAYSMKKGKELAVVGPAWRELAREYWSRFRPHVALAPAEGDTGQIPLLAGRHQPGTTLAYVCEGFVCDLPTADREKLAEQLG